MSSERNARKSQLVSLVLRLSDAGLRSPELIGAALGVSRVTVWRILATRERRAVPRLADLPADLRAEVAAFHSPPAEDVKHPLTESPAKKLAPA